MANAQIIEYTKMKNTKLCHGCAQPIKGYYSDSELIVRLPNGDENSIMFHNDSCLTSFLDGKFNNRRCAILAQRARKSSSHGEC
jgi:hypothetical protein